MLIAAPCTLDRSHRRRRVRKLVRRIKHSAPVLEHEARQRCYRHNLDERTTFGQTLVAATRHGAAVCGVGAELGTVEAGKLADLIVVAANPLEDITNVRRLQLVLKEGQVVSDKRHLSGTVPRPM